MADQYNNHNIDKDEEEIDIVWLIRYVWSKRKIIIYTTCITFLICMLVFICKPKMYTSTASILPVSQNQGVSGSMGMLASMAGVNLKQPSTNVITPDLYPAVAASTPFMKKLMEVPVKWKWNDGDTIMSTLSYVTNKKKSVGDYIRAYTIGLPSTIMGMFNSQSTNNIDVLLAEENVIEPSYVVLSSFERSAMSMLMGSVSVMDDPKISAINVSATCESPEQAVVLASTALDILQEIITEYKTKRSALTLGFLEERYKEIQDDYEKVRKQFFAYKDSHRNMIDERSDIEYQQLSDQYQISYSILKTLANQLEEAKLEVMEETPVFSVLQPAIMPNVESSPNFKKYSIVGIVLGLFFSVGWIVAQIVYYQVFDTKKYLAIKSQYEIKEEETV